MDLVLGRHDLLSASLESAKGDGEQVSWQGTRLWGCKLAMLRLSAWLQVLSWDSRLFAPIRCFGLRALVVSLRAPISMCISCCLLLLVVPSGLDDDAHRTMGSFSHVGCYLRLDFPVLRIQ